MHKPLEQNKQYIHVDTEAREVHMVLSTGGGILTIEQCVHKAIKEDNNNAEIIGTKQINTISTSFSILWILLNWPRSQ